DEARFRPEAPRGREHRRERGPGPLGDGRPALLTDVRRDLGASRQALQLGQGDRRRGVHQAPHLEAPVFEAAGEQPLVRLVARVGLPPRWKVPHDVAGIVLLHERLVGHQQPLRRHGEPVRDAGQATPPRRRGQVAEMAEVAPREGEAGEAGGAAEEAAAGEDRG
ncbi:hypothetical protein RZS08_21635, partial [Arthrospira platensis SPKY1]|nr:hypothetical protein [Arthrospira platensis SPKY1]